MTNTTLRIDKVSGNLRPSIDSSHALNTCHTLGPKQTLNKSFKPLPSLLSIVLPVLNLSQVGLQEVSDLSKVTE